MWTDMFYHPIRIGETSHSCNSENQSLCKHSKFLLCIRCLEVSHQYWDRSIVNDYTTLVSFDGCSVATENIRDGYWTSSQSFNLQGKKKRKGWASDFSFFFFFFFLCCCFLSASLSAWRQEGLFLNLHRLQSISSEEQRGSTDIWTKESGRRRLSFGVFNRPRVEDATDLFPQVFFSSVTPKKGKDIWGNREGKK